jgi:prepilin-type N-terminal cleavage/methylation domain-containing protein
MTASIHSSPPRRLQRGLTLVELMVGLALGLIVTTALLTLLANASANGQNLARAGLSSPHCAQIGTRRVYELARRRNYFGSRSVL